MFPKDYIRKKFESLKRGDVIFFNYKDVRSEPFTVTDKVIYPNSSYGEVGSLRIGKMSAIHFYFELPINDSLNQQALSVKKVNDINEIRVIGKANDKSVYDLGKKIEKFLLGTINVDIPNNAYREYQNILNFYDVEGMDKFYMDGYSIYELFHTNPEKLQKLYKELLDFKIKYDIK